MQVYFKYENNCQLKYAYESGWLSGYCFYETNSMYDRDTPIDAEGHLKFKSGLLEEIRDQVIALGLHGS